MKTTSISIWYRRRASGVRKPLPSQFGTGERLLGYELLSGTCVVQERGLWGTNCSPERVWYRRGASGVRTTLRNVSGTGEGSLGYEPHSKRVRYRRGASDVRNAPQNALGTGKWVLVYRINEKRIPVQGLNFIRLTITILTEIFDNYEELQ